MDRSALEEIQRALDAARNIAHDGSLDACDAADLEDIIAPVEIELHAQAPNLQTLTTYLNSLARSLRANPAHRTTCMQIDAAMRHAGVPTQWEH
jgi:hypothetical protein